MAIISPGRWGIAPALAILLRTAVLLGLSEELAQSAAEGFHAPPYDTSEVKLFLPDIMPASAWHIGFAVT